MPVYPISFSISSKKLCKDIPKKTRILAPLIPGNISTYIYKTEEEYYKMYQESYFAITMEKGGWDCMRHYEIIANRCIPIFLNIEQCPHNIMTKLPKLLLQEINNFYFKNIQHKNSITEITNEEISNIMFYTEKLYNIIKDELTNKSIAKYILNNINIENRQIKKILFLSGCTNPDYLRCTILCGFKDIFNKLCHDYPKVPHIYTNYTLAEECYGRGFTYTRLLDENTERDSNFDNTIINDIENNNYDLIIYGSYHRGMPYWDIVNKYYNKNQIILICGEDTHNCNYLDYSNNEYNVFVRELR